MKFECVDESSFIFGVLRKHFQCSRKMFKTEKKNLHHHHHQSSSISQFVWTHNLVYLLRSFRSNWCITVSNSNRTHMSKSMRAYVNVCKPLFYTCQTHLMPVHITAVRPKRKYFHFSSAKKICFDSFVFCLMWKYFDRMRWCCRHNWTREQFANDKWRSTVHHNVPMQSR